MRTKRKKRIDTPIEYHRDGELLISVAIEGGDYHLCISCADRLPTYEELKEARYKYCPNDCYMAQIFPPKEEFVNVNPYCLHLWEVDGCR